MPAIVASRQSKLWPPSENPTNTALHRLAVIGLFATLLQHCSLESFSSVFCQDVNLRQTSQREAFHDAYRHINYCLTWCMKKSGIVAKLDIENSDQVPMCCSHLLILTNRSTPGSRRSEDWRVSEAGAAIGDGCGQVYRPAVLWIMNAATGATANIWFPRHLQASEIDRLEGLNFYQTTVSQVARRCRYFPWLCICISWPIGYESYDNILTYDMRLLNVGLYARKLTRSQLNLSQNRTSKLKLISRK